MVDRTVSPEAPVSDYVPYRYQVTPSIISTRHGDYCSTWRLGGRTFEGYSKAQKTQWIEELNNLFKGFPPGWAVYTHTIRRRVTEYPVSDYPCGFSREYDAAYRRSFEGRPPMLNELYLTVLTRLQVDPALRFFARFERRSRQSVEAWQRQAVEQLDDMNRRIGAAMKRYAPELLTAFENGTVVRSAAAEFYGRLLNGSHETVPLCGAPLHAYLPRARLFFSPYGELGALRYLGSERKFLLVEIREYPRGTDPGHLDSLLNLPCEFVLTQSFAALSKAEGDAALARQIKWLEDSKDPSKSQIEDLRQARDDLAAGKFVMGDHHATVAVFGETSEEVYRKAADVIRVLASEDIIARPVDRANVAAWFAQLPGNWMWRPRPASITSLNFFGLSSGHNYLFGKPAGNPWGPAVTMLKTRGGTPYYFSFHASMQDADEQGKRRLGNTSVIGQSGTGKSVLLAHLLTQARKFGATTAVFDKDRGLQPTVMQLGGKYYPLRYGEPTGWNPFQLERSPQNLAFLRRLVQLLAHDGDVSPTLAEQREIERAVDRLQHLARDRRRLTTLLQFIPAGRPDDGRLSLRERLARWCEGGEHGWLLDNPTDTLSLDVDTFGFDLTELLVKGPVRDAALAHLLYRVEQLNDGRRFLYMFDEVQHALQVPEFQAMTRDVSRTTRKKNGALVFATQEPGALLENPVGSSLIQQTATAIYLPNPRASRDEYVDGFKLSQSEYEMVRSLGEFSRQFLVKQGESAVTATLDLSQCQDALMVFGGSPDMAAIAEQAVAERGADPQAWLDLYLERARAAGRS